VTASSPVAEKHTASPARRKTSLHCVPRFHTKEISTGQSGPAGDGEFQCYLFAAQYERNGNYEYVTEILCVIL
jgi:hypothetical protein